MANAKKRKKKQQRYKKLLKEMVAWMYCLAEDYPIGDNEALCDSVARAEEALGTVQVYGVEFIPDEDVFPTEGEESEGDE